jgi:hypothetical protein
MKSWIGTLTLLQIVLKIEVPTESVI